MTGESKGLGARGVLLAVAVLTAVVSLLWKPVILGIRPLPTGETNPYFTIENVWTKEQAEELLKLVKSRKSYFTAVEDQTSVIEDIGEATEPVVVNGELLCEHPYLALNKNRTSCILPSRIDVGRHYLLTGGREARREVYEPLLSRLQVFNGFFFDKLDAPEFAALFKSEDYLKKASAVCEGRTFYDPIQLGVVISLPGQEAAMHWDVPWFFGASRFLYPQWLLVAMQQSGLFQSRRVPQVQGVAYLHHWINSETDGGEFYYYPEGAGGDSKLFKAQFNNAIVVDGSIVVHGVDPYHPVKEGIPPLPMLDKSVRHALTYVGNDEWNLQNERTKQVLQKYRTQDLRISLVWRCRCFKDEAEMKKWNAETSPNNLASALPLADIMDTLKNDLVKRGRLTSDAAEIKPLDLAMLILDEYTRMPVPQTWMPYNYCMGQKFLPPVFHPVFSLLGCKTQLRVLCALQTAHSVRQNSAATSHRKGAGTPHVDGSGCVRARGSSPVVSFGRFGHADQLEQEIEDFNAPLRFTRQLHRRVIVLPLDSNFEVAATHFSHGRLQHGDKIALPASIGYQLLALKLQPPWQFEVKKLTTAENEAHTSAYGNANDQADSETASDALSKRPQLDRVFGSVLAFNAPENFIFVPDWMMQALGMQPFDVAEIRCVKMKMASSVSLQPHSAKFAAIPNQQSVLENELRHYSALTTGTTISFLHDKEVYKLDVVEAKSGRSTVDAVCVQDSDVATNIIPASKSKTDASRSKQ